MNCSSNKVPFETQEAAHIRLAEIRKKTNDVRYPKACYKCKECGKWHLTSIKKWVSPEEHREWRVQRIAEYFIRKNNW